MYNQSKVPMPTNNRHVRPNTAKFEQNKNKAEDEDDEKLEKESLLSTTHRVKLTGLIHLPRFALGLGVAAMFGALCIAFRSPSVVYIEEALIFNDHTWNEPVFRCGVEEYEAAYKLAMTEMATNIVNGTFIAGAGWTQLWTRDTSYAVELSAGLIHPSVSVASIRACTEQSQGIGTVWLQDECGHFGGWPNLSDAIVGAQGAWALYTTTGDQEFLSWAYEVTKNSLARAERDVYDASTGLFLGCSSFMESNSGYPPKYEFNGTLVGQTKALSTNILHYTGYKLAAMMGQQLKAKEFEIDRLQTKANNLRHAIRSRLWLAKKGYYSYFEDEENHLLKQMETLGESLVLLAPDFEHDPLRIDSIFQNTHRTDVGIPCLWPKFKNQSTHRKDPATYYHNGRIWPFVQGYWAYAAAKHGKVDIFAEEFANLLELSRRNRTFAEFYELDGSFPKTRKRQLWSDAGFLAMVYHGLFGMNFMANGIRFGPVKPQIFAHVISLENLRYRSMILDIYIEGSGSSIASFELDGKKQDAFVPAKLKGKHKILIILE